MLAKKIALGFGIAVIFPLLVYYGAKTFTPTLDWDDYSLPNFEQQLKNASPAKQIELRTEQNKLQDQFFADKENIKKRVFVTKIALGLSAIIIGSLISIQTIGTGLILGGTFSLLENYLGYWSSLTDSLRFISLLVAFCVLIFVSYNKMSQKQSKR